MLLLLSIYRLRQSIFNFEIKTYTFALRDFHETIEYFGVFSVYLTQLFLLLVLMRSHLIYVYIDLSLDLPIRKHTNWLHLTKVRHREQPLFIVLPPEFLLLNVNLHQLSPVLRVQPIFN